MQNVTVFASLGVPETSARQPQTHAFEHPVVMSTTTDTGVRPAAPANDSTLVITTPRSFAAPADPAQEQTAFGF
jgi:hypothetical protein